MHILRWSDGFLRYNVLMLTCMNQCQHNEKDKINVGINVALSASSQVMRCRRYNWLTCMNHCQHNEPTDKDKVKVGMSNRESHNSERLAFPLPFVSRTHNHPQGRSHLFLAGHTVWNCQRLQTGRCKKVGLSSKLHMGLFGRKWRLCPPDVTTRPGLPALRSEAAM